MKKSKKTPQKKSGIFASWFEDEFSALIADPAERAVARGKLIRQIEENSGIAGLGNLFVGLLTVICFVGSPAFLVSVGWFLIFLAVIAITLNKRSDKFVASNHVLKVEGDHVQIFGALTIGVVWAVMPILLFGMATPFQKIFIFTAIASLIGVGAFVLAGVPRAAKTFVTVVASGAFVTLLINWRPEILTLLLVTAMYLSFVISLIHNNALTLAQRFLAESELAKTNELVGMLVQEHEDSGYEWFWELGSNGRIANVSQKFASAAGLEIDQLNGRSLGDVLINIVPEASDYQVQNHVQHTSNMFEAVMGRHPFRDCIHAYDHPNGQRLWWKLSGRPVNDEDGRYVGYRGIALDVTEEIRFKEKITQMALKDSLTGLANRASFYDGLAKAFENAKLHQKHLALFILDLDKFKNINDTLGHPAGDALLIGVANRLQAAFGDYGMVARLGGDEYSLYIENVADAQALKQYAQRVLDCFKKPFEFAGRTISVNTSVGIGVAPQHGTDVDTLVGNADLALYRAKTVNNSSFNLFEADMDLQLRNRRLLDQELQSADFEKEFHLVYQPLFDTQSQQIIGYESLLRWHNPRCGEVSPDVFIEIAEDNGMIVDIGKWVIQRACRDAVSWGNNHKVAVNLSPRQFVGVKLESYIANCLAESGLLPSRLELEITETSIIINKDVALKSLNNLRKLGIRISLDDFGTGYSSLSYLVSYPFDKIKIDRSFVQGLLDDPESEVIVRTIVGMAENLKMRITVEGVEKPEQYQLLSRLGCQEIQGFLISKPLKNQSIHNHLLDPINGGLKILTDQYGLVSSHQEVSHNPQEALSA